MESLARYTHRIAISDARILSVDDTQVTFRYTDYRDGNKARTMNLQGGEFVRRYLQHILPWGLMRVRNFGFLANRCRREKLAVIRRALAASNDPTSVGEGKQKTEELSMPSLEPRWPCPTCRTGLLRLVAQVLPCRPLRLAPG